MNTVRGLRSRASLPGLRGFAAEAVFGDEGRFDEVGIETVSARDSISGYELLLCKGSQESMHGCFGHMNRLRDLA
jgi:hypothetical protein